MGENGQGDDFWCHILGAVNMDFARIGTIQGANRILTGGDVESREIKDLVYDFAFWMALLSLVWGVLLGLCLVERLGLMLHGGDDRFADFLRDRGDSPTFLLCEFICRKKSFDILLKSLPLIRQCVLAVLKNPIEDMAQHRFIKFPDNLLLVLPVAERIRQRLPQFRFDGGFQLGFKKPAKTAILSMVKQTQYAIPLLPYFKGNEV